MSTGKTVNVQAEPGLVRPHPLNAKLREPAVDEPISAAMRRQLKASRENHKRGEVYTLEEARKMLGLRKSMTEKKAVQLQKDVASPPNHDTLPFTPAERRQLRQARKEAARGETTEGRSFFAELPRIEVNSMDEVPNFESDAEASAYWDTHTMAVSAFDFENRGPGPELQAILNRKPPKMT